MTMDPGRGRAPVRAGQESKNYGKEAQKAAAQKLAEFLEHHPAEEELDFDGDYSSHIVGQRPPPIATGNSRMLPFFSPDRSPDNRLIRVVPDHLPSSAKGNGRPTDVHTSGQRRVNFRPSDEPSPMYQAELSPIKRNQAQPTAIKQAAALFPSVYFDGQGNKRQGAGFDPYVMTSEHEALVLQDKIDMLEEENAKLHHQLLFSEERLNEADAKATLYEKQVAKLGEGISLEEKLLIRQEAASKGRESALREDVRQLKGEIEGAKEKEQSFAEQLQKAENDLKLVQLITHRLILSNEEMASRLLRFHKFEFPTAFK